MTTSYLAFDLIVSAVGRGHSETAHAPRMQARATPRRVVSDTGMQKQLGAHGIVGAWEL
jgi:hypothetical protein